MDVLKINPEKFATSQELLRSVLKAVKDMESEFLHNGNPFKNNGDDDVLVHCRDIQAECRKIYAAAGLLAHLHELHHIRKLLECSALLSSYIEKATFIMRSSQQAIMRQVPNDTINPNDLAERWLSEPEPTASDDVPF